MRGLGLGITGSGFHPAIVRAHCRAMALSSISGNRRRNSTAADNSPSRSKMSRMAAASSSVTTNIPIEWDGRAKSTRKQPKSGDRRHNPPVSCRLTPNSPFSRMAHLRRASDCRTGPSSPRGELRRGNAMQDGAQRERGIFADFGLERILRRLP